MENGLPPEKITLYKELSANKYEKYLITENIDLKKSNICLSFHMENSFKK